MTKISAKNNAVELRNQGYSYNYISQKTGVSKSTLSVWLSDILYTPNQETITKIGWARARSGQVKSQQKRESILRARKTAKKYRKVNKT